MKKKILAVLLAAALLPSAVHAEEKYFETELAEINGLLAQCDSAKIDTPYEDLGYSVLEKFAKYIEQDETQNVDEAQLSYNKGYMTTLYEEVKNNLTLYLSGEKSPLKVTPYDMSEFDNFKSKGRSVYSIGYGHGTLVRDEVDEMNSFGATNIQVETGPTFVLTELPSFSVKKSDAEYTVENNSAHGNYLNVKAPGGSISVSQNVKVEQGREYSFGLSTRASSTGGTLEIRAGSTVQTLNSKDIAYSWTDNGFTYTASGTEEITFSLTVKNTDLIMLDDLYFKDSDGNNLLYNGGFEDTYDKKHIAKLKDDLECAYENNVTVCLLLSPHYFPEDLEVEGETVYHTEGKNGFIEFNIGLDETKAIIKEYLDALLPEIKDCRAISSICLTNEPVFIAENWYDYYAPRFCEWLQKEYGEISVLNEKWNSTYASFSEIEMPKQWTTTPLHYDYIRFNDELNTEWHKWLADIVKSYLPDMPVHAKTMATLSTSNPNGVMRHGSKPELFDSFSDWAGNDSGSFLYKNDDGSYDYSSVVLKMMWYDFLSSITDKPIYNSEDHIIPNSQTTFDEIYAKHSRGVLWQEMMHNGNMSSIWHWNRSYNIKSDACNSVLHRPDCIYEIGRTALDLNRLSEYVDRITGKASKTAIFYSQSSRNYGSTHMKSMAEIYEQLITLGQPVDFVMETDMSKLSDYKVLVVGNAVNTTAEAAAAIKKFIADGGTVVSIGSQNLTKDEYNKTADFGITGMTAVTSDKLGNALTGILEKENLLRVKLVDDSTGKMAENIDWSFDIDGENVLINLIALDSAHNISVYLDGEKLEGLVDLIEDENFDGAVQGFEPVLLSTAERAKISEKVQISSVSGDTVTWTSGDEAYAGANIYRVKAGQLELIKNTKAFSYTADGDDTTLIIKACDSSGNESEGVSVGIKAGQLLRAYISDGKAYVKNDTGKVQAGVLTINLKDSEGNVLKRVQKSFILKANESTSANVTFTAGAGQSVTAEIVGAIGG